MALRALLGLAAVLLVWPVASLDVRRLRVHSLGSRTSQTSERGAGAEEAPARSSSTSVAPVAQHPIPVPVYVASDGNSSKLVEQRFAHNFTDTEVAALNYSQTHGMVQAPAHPCHPGNTIFDLGFYNGADSLAYLAGGYCVVGVEADPDLVASAVEHFAVWLHTAQLQMVNAAIAPSGQVDRWTTFYRNKCTREWNSFYSAVGCRGCDPPHAAEPQNCQATPVRAVDCKAIFDRFGKAEYMKLDIEGAEMGCFTALKGLGGQWLPRFISAEITEVGYIDALQSLGYGLFKLVRQDWTHSGSASQSGPWGDSALDCRTGTSWRPYSEARNEMLAILAKSFDAYDACPGGVQSVKNTSGQSSTATAYMWYDVHATLSAATVAAAAGR